MFFKQFYLPSLGHASYLVGSEDSGEALVLDVRRDVETYFSEAGEQGMRIRYACDTHQHNDYLSGVCELPERGEIQLLAGARAEVGYPVRAFAWRTAGKPIDVLPQWTVQQLRRALDQDRDLVVLGVRQPAEWSAGHIPRARHITGAEIAKRADELPKDRPIAAICGSGYRSSVAASLLKTRGHREVYNVLGGMTGWEAEGFHTAT